MENYHHPQFIEQNHKKHHPVNVEYRKVVLSLRLTIELILFIGFISFKHVLGFLSRNEIETNCDNGEKDNTQNPSKNLIEDLLPYRDIHVVP